MTTTCVTVNLNEDRPDLYLQTINENRFQFVAVEACGVKFFLRTTEQAELMISILKRASEELALMEDHEWGLNPDILCEVSVALEPFLDFGYRLDRAQRASIVGDPVDGARWKFLRTDGALAVYGYAVPVPPLYPLD